MQRDTTEILAVVVLLVAAIIVLIIAVPLLLRVIKEFKNYGQAALIILILIILAWTFIEIFRRWNN